MKDREIEVSLYQCTKCKRVYDRAPYGKCSTTDCKGHMRLIARFKAIDV